MGWRREPGDMFEHEIKQCKIEHTFIAEKFLGIEVGEDVAVKVLRQIL